MLDILENLNYYLIIIGVVLFFSSYASKLSERFGVPLLLIFLAIGMILGEEGLGGIKFSNAVIAQAVGTVALIFILYSGALETKWEDVRSVALSGVLLATLGVIITAFVMAGFIWIIYKDASFLDSLLFASIVSSTDAAAVFAILRGQQIRLKNNLSPLLELESGANDPMAIFLTIAVIQLITLGANADFDGSIFAFKFLAQFGVGIAFGVLFGLAFPLLCNHLNLTQSGLYPLISVAWMFVIFGASSVCYGNGFLSIYIAGVMSSRTNFYSKENIHAFHNAIAWMMQIIIFLTLGLLVYPSKLATWALAAITVSLVLMFIARPVAVFITLAFSRFNLREKCYISWVGLRGAVPIILATYPYIYQIAIADIIFNVVFFMVLISVLLQGMSLPFVAKWLGVAEK